MPLRRTVILSYIYHIPMLPAAIPVIGFLTGMSGSDASSDKTGEQSRFEEHAVESHNQAVKLAGSLLLPRSEVPLPAVVFVHGAGRHTRGSLREVGEYFASNGVAALIYDKRGTGESGGAYESSKPYENLVNDALSAVTFLKHRREIAESHIGIWGLSQGAYISARPRQPERRIFHSSMVYLLVAPHVPSLTSKPSALLHAQGHSPRVLQDRVRPPTSLPMLHLQEDLLLQHRHRLSPPPAPALWIKNCRCATNT